MDYTGLFIAFGASFIVFYLFAWLVLFPYHEMTPWDFFMYLIKRKDGQ